MEEGRMKPVTVTKNPSRRVSFELPSHRHTRSTSSDIYSSIDHLDRDRNHHYCFACCAWSCLVAVFFVIAFLFIGITYLAFLKSAMPKVYVRAFNITKLQVDDGSQKMNSVIGLGLVFSNKNDRLKLLYAPLSIDVRSEEVGLGKTDVGGFDQMPLNETNLDLMMTVENVDADKYAAGELQSDIQVYEVVFDVYVGGHIGFKVRSLQMSNVPFLASCRQIKKMDVDFGRRPECDVKMFVKRPQTN